MDEEQQPSAVRIPSPWRAMAALSEAWQVLEANPDLVGDDIKIALESEAPDAVALLNAIIHTIQDKQDINVAREQRLGRLEVLITRDDAAIAKLRMMLVNILPQLKLEFHRAPGGLATLTHHKGKVIVTDENLVPPEFKKDVTTTSILKDKIAKEFDAKRTVPGAERANAYTSIRIT